jgi:CBS domain-containing protein
MPKLSTILASRAPVVNLLGPEDSVATAVRVMADARVGCVLVVEGAQLVGIFSERDVLRRVLAAERRPENTRLRDVMTCDPITATPDDNRTTAILKMHALGCRHLPIVADGRIVDTVSIRDLLYDEITDRENEISELRRYIHGEA